MAKMSTMLMLGFLFSTISRLPQLVFFQLELARHEQIVPGLPAYRPADWDYRPQSSAKLTHSNLTCGAQTLLIEHAPLEGVTAEMVEWWFANHHDPSVPVMHPNDGKLYNAYMLWHPRDHVVSCYVGDKSPGLTPAEHVGSHIHILEILNSPAGGFTPERPPLTPGIRDPEGVVVEGSYSLVSDIAKVARLDRGGFSLHFAKPPIETPFAIIDHSWEDSEDGLVVKSLLQIGEHTEHPVLKHVMPATNSIGRRLGMGTNFTHWLDRWATHCVEEIGNFPFFLPDYFGGKLAVPEGTVIPPHFNNGFTCPDYEIKQVVRIWQRWFEEIPGTVQSFFEPEKMALFVESWTDYITNLYATFRAQ